jgi:hypothetical protein
MKNADLALRNGSEALLSDTGLMVSPRPTVDRQKLEEHLRSAMKLLHVDLQDENLRDTPRRWAESLVTMTSGYDFTDVKRLSACSEGLLGSGPELSEPGRHRRHLQDSCAHHPPLGHFIVGTFRTR